MFRVFVNCVWHRLVPINGACGSNEADRVSPVFLRGQDLKCADHGGENEECDGWKKHFAWSLPELPYP